MFVSWEVLISEPYMENYSRSPYSSNNPKAASVSLHMFFPTRFSIEMFAHRALYRSLSTSHYPCNVIKILYSTIVVVITVVILHVVQK